MHECNNNCNCNNKYTEFNDNWFVFYSYIKAVWILSNIENKETEGLNCLIKIHSRYPVDELFIIGYWNANVRRKIGWVN